MSKRSQIPKGWKELALEDFLIPALRKVEKPSTTYKRLGLRSHGKGTFITDVEDPNDVAMDFLYEVKKDDLIVNITFAWEGAIAIIKEADEGALVSHRFPTYAFNRDVMTPEYFQHAVLTKKFFYMLKAISPGGAGRNRVLNKKDFLKLRVLIPPVAEQIKIFNILNTWDKNIDLIGQLVIAKKKLKRSIMQQLLTGKIHVTDDDENWHEYKIEEVCSDFLSGGTPSTALGEYWTGKIPWITGSDFGDLRIVKVRKFITEEAVKNSATNIIEKDNILVVTRVGVGKLAIAPFDIAISQDTTGLILNRKIVTPEFMLYALALTIAHLSKLNQGTSILGVTRKDLRAHKILLPSLMVQQKINKVLKVIHEEIDLLTKQQNLYRQQKKGLTQNLLSGQIRVKV